MAPSISSTSARSAAVPALRGAKARIADGSIRIASTRNRIIAVAPCGYCKA